MTKFVGCIDLHDGQVKQIVGGTLKENDDSLKTNFVSSHPPAYYAKLYQDNNISGCHVIKLGPNNDNAAREALEAAPGFLQVGGGINDENCEEWLKNASKVIVTSWLFSKEGEFLVDRLKQLSSKCGADRIVVDLSCRKTTTGKWVVAMNKWQTLTNLELNEETFAFLSKYTDEFLIHAADVEGLCKGIDEQLVSKLYEWTKSLRDNKDIKIVYAGGAKSVEDLKLVDKLSHGAVDLTYGSALDIFGGNLVKFDDCCAWNTEQA
ncbi:1-(5-phosphoribosyl)-5-[(5-phosphoribosylamino)methylideneamino] imidazole-4-carboxamide isomerase [Nakaseomyces bracarensis]|uniref:1-(5-phosphoribosyl)-5-[(5-phosphoribosylamino)methylideneamino] imidazole-4-carboxamide isomerase n=1 Tax=Nakaseomyces bracarensis TaxID=273131 RepID=A0ABR4NW98_9SACH